MGGFGAYVFNIFLMIFARLADYLVFFRLPTPDGFSIFRCPAAIPVACGFLNGGSSRSLDIEQWDGLPFLVRVGTVSSTCSDTGDVFFDSKWHRGRVSGSLYVCHVWF